MIQTRLFSTIWNSIGSTDLKSGEQYCNVLSSVDSSCETSGILFLLFKGSRTGHFVKVSLWYASLLINTRFRFLYFRISNC